MANLYMHQMERGGIIDENADESNVISIQSEDASEQVSKDNNKIDFIIVCLFGFKQWFFLFSNFNLFFKSNFCVLAIT